LENAAATMEQLRSIRLASPLSGVSNPDDMMVSLVVFYC